MKIKIVLFSLLIAFVSCNKEESNTEKLLPQYLSIINIWKPISVSYDSIGVRAIHPIPYDRLQINSNLSYKVFLDSTNNSIEDGTIKIISQSKDILEIYFAAEYPNYSLFSGSHIFGHQNVVLDSLGFDVLILKASESYHFQNIEFVLEKY